MAYTFSNTRRKRRRMQERSLLRARQRASRMQELQMLLKALTAPGTMWTPSLAGVREQQRKVASYFNEPFVELP